MPDASFLVGAPDDDLRRAAYDLDKDELRFVIEYVVDCDPGRAYAAVFAFTEDPTVLGKKMLNRPMVTRAVVAEMNAVGAEVAKITKNALMLRFWQEATNPGAKPAERLKALEALARMKGDLEPREDNKAPSVNVTFVDNRTTEVRMEDIMSDAQEVKVLDNTPPAPMFTVSVVEEKRDPVPVPIPVVVEVEQVKEVVERPMPAIEV